MTDRARAYIDGFNFYYGAVKGTRHRWLDYEALCCSLVRNLRLNEVHYFTARVKSRPDDPGLPQRQDLYLRALQTRPLVKITFGTFAQRDKDLPLTQSVKRPPVKFVRVRTEEEKGSDVNLAAWLLHDAFLDRYDTAIVLSNDSDLQTPIDMALEIGKKIYVVNPHHHSGQRDHLLGSGPVRLRKHHLLNCQLPDEVEGLDGKTIHKPESWY